MDSETTRRHFLLGGSMAATAGLLASDLQAEEPHAGHKHETPKTTAHEHHAPGTPVGAANDRGKLVAGRRAAGQSPVPVETPDVPKLPWKMNNGVKEFHLTAEHLKREFLPDQWFDVWGFNGSMPGPTIEAVEGDRVRIIVHN